MSTNRRFPFSARPSAVPALWERRAQDRTPRRVGSVRLWNPAVPNRFTARHNSGSSIRWLDVPAELRKSGQAMQGNQFLFHGVHYDVEHALPLLSGSCLRFVRKSALGLPGAMGLDRAARQCIWR